MKSFLFSKELQQIAQSASDMASSKSFLDYPQHLQIEGACPPSDVAQVPATLVCGIFLRFENQRIFRPRRASANAQVSLAQCERVFSIVNRSDYEYEADLHEDLADHLEEIGFNLAPPHKPPIKDGLGVYVGDIMVAVFDIKLGFAASADAQVQSAAYYLNALTLSDQHHRIEDVRTDENLRETLILYLVDNFLFINMGIRRNGLVQVANLSVLNTQAPSSLIGLFRVLNFLKETREGSDGSIIYPGWDEDEQFSDLKLDLLSAICQPSYGVYLLAEEQECEGSLFKGFQLFSKEEAISVVSTLVGAISVLHTAGYVHGDLHLPNLMVNREMPAEVRIVDFEFAGKERLVCFPRSLNSKESWVLSPAVTIKDVSFGRRMTFSCSDMR